MLPFIDKDDWRARNRSLKAINKDSVIDPIAGEPLRFHVQSRTVDDLRYLVDLEEHGFNGACGCQDFDFRKRMLVKKVFGDAARCWHIVQAREYFINAVLKRMATNFYKK